MPLMRTETREEHAAVRRQVGISAALWVLQEITIKYLGPAWTLLLPSIRPKYPLLGTIYPQLRVQGGSWVERLTNVWRLRDHISGLSTCHPEKTLPDRSASMPMWGSWAEGQGLRFTEPHRQCKSCLANLLVFVIYFSAGIVSKSNRLRIADLIPSKSLTTLNTNLTNEKMRCPIQSSPSPKHPKSSVRDPKL